MSDSGPTSAGEAPRVSIITAAFNAGPFIEATIDSVRKQTLADWEMLVVDDASADRTADIVQDISVQDPRVILIRLQQNSGVSVARNTALAQARAPLIAFLDSDDLWLPEKLEHQVDFMARQDAALSYTSYRRISEDGGRIGRLLKAPSRLTYNQLLKNTAIATVTAMVDTRKTGQIRMTEARRDDYILWLSILKRGLLGHGLQEDLARYRVVRGSLSSKPKRSAAWVWTVYRRVEKLGPLRAAWCMAHYGTRAVLKRLVF